MATPDVVVLVRLYLRFACGGTQTLNVPSVSKADDHSPPVTALFMLSDFFPSEFHLLYLYISTWTTVSAPVHESTAALFLAKVFRWT